MRIKRQRDLRSTLFFVANTALLLFSIEVAVDLVMWSDFAVASTQGVVGNNSTGSIGISITKSSVAQIGGLKDMIILAWTESDSDITWSSDICVYSTRSGGYTITATGAKNEDGRFVLRDGDKTMPYNLLWNSGGSGNLSNEGIELSPGIPSAVISHASKDSASCQGSNPGPTARIIVNIPKSTLQGAVDGNYVEVLTLLVAPS